MVKQDMTDVFNKMRELAKSYDVTVLTASQPRSKLVMPPSGYPNALLENPIIIVDYIGQIKS